MGRRHPLALGGIPLLAVAGGSLLLVGDIHPLEGGTLVPLRGLELRGTSLAEVGMGLHLAGRHWGRAVP